MTVTIAEWVVWIIIAYCFVSVVVNIIEGYYRWRLYQLTKYNTILKLADAENAMYGEDGDMVPINPECQATFDTENGWRCAREGCTFQHPLPCAEAYRAATTHDERVRTMQ